jgi:hypothetical protein
MANAVYKLGAQHTLNKEIDWDSDTLKAALVSNAYAVNLTTHEFYSDISANVLGTPQALTTKSIALGVFDADDVTFSAVAGGSTALAVVIYKDTGTAGTSPLLIYDDTITGFPLATNGGDIIIPVGQRLQQDREVRVRKWLRGRRCILGQRCPARPL